MLGRWLQKPLGIARPRLLAARHLDEVISTEDLRYAELGGLERQALHMHDHVEDAVRLIDAAAERMALVGVEAPVRIIILMPSIGAADVRSALAPGNAQGVENVGLSTAGRLPDGRRRNETCHAHASVSIMDHLCRAYSAAGYGSASFVPPQ